MVSKGIHEECGVLGIYSPNTASLAPLVYYGLFALQHRGQESCGIVVCDDGLFTSYKDTGLLTQVFTPDIMNKFPEGNIAVGHVRYGTSGTDDRANSQPLVVNHMKGRMAIAHNGSLVNAKELRQQLEMEGSIFQSNSHAEIMAHNIIKERIKSASIEEAISKAMVKLKGAFSFVIMSPSKMIAVRDPNGFRPLCIGQREDGSYVIASEDCALVAIQAKFIRDVEPGEIVVFDKNGMRCMKDHCGTAKKATCIFEYIYTARPDSVIDGISVHEARLRAGACLAKRHPVEADVVFGVPDSGLDAALGYSRQSGIPYGVGFIKNRYIGRTFIEPGQASRENLVRMKLSPMKSVVKGKRVIMVDDSIVRGTTCGHIVKLLRDAGAAEVHVRISSPPYLNPCYYGTDIKSRDKLVACKHTLEEIRQMFDADSLGYLELEDLGTIVGQSGCEGFCCACFDNNYPTEIPSVVEENRFEYKISENRGKK